ncbi:hypothetical protein M378DRAFT_85514 [Amanita muscaria Koide BX008]|uniref:DUF6699 domain-containing protein n=1 Tax=Amanita muscaria (strain Koide BX008) TaxID=946122 RepID=A0A0C2S8L0_AMAMK|nr:hypothetical protein M378DRAFT_85514 [Amanita muscaria Koide BX008]
MTGPHVYGANSTYPTPHQTPYTGYYNTPQHSPFIPPADLGNHPPSPYRGSSPLPTTAELTPNTGPVPFPGTYDGGGYPTYPYTRPRAPSYHGPPYTSPFVPPVAPLAPNTPPWPRQQRLSNPMYPGVVPGAVYPVSPWSGVTTPLPGTFVDPSGSFSLHPFLDGETPRLDFMLNLALQTFAPMQSIPNGPHVPVPPDILSQPATHPPVYRLKIVCDQLLDWPITLEYDPEQYRQQTGAMLSYPPPITMGDVLSQVHKTLHGRISHHDWAKIDERKRYKITQAYTARCMTAPSMEHLMRSDGVKKVDYLLDKVWFRGLVRTNDGPEVLKLIVSRRAN